MSAFHLPPVTAPAPISQASRPVEAPKPPKAQSDHKPANPTTSSRGPAVVLSGALAKPPERQGQQAHSAPTGTGQHVNRLI